MHCNRLPLNKKAKKNWNDGKWKLPLRYEKTWRGSSLTKDCFFMLLFLIESLSLRWHSHMLASRQIYDRYNENSGCEGNDIRQVSEVLRAFWVIQQMPLIWDIKCAISFLKLIVVAQKQSVIIKKNVVTQVYTMQTALQFDVPSQ